MRRLAAASGEAKIIAGGQTLVPLLAMRLARPTLILDINAIAELQGIEADGDDVGVRACTRQAAALDHAMVHARVPLLAKALTFVGHGQTRNRGTIGGSLANADPAAEIGLAALALDAKIEARCKRRRARDPHRRLFHRPDGDHAGGRRMPHPHPLSGVARCRPRSASGSRR